MSGGYSTQAQAKNLGADSKVKGTLPGVIKDALYHDISILILSAQIRGKVVNQNAICERFDVSRSALKNVIRHPDFITVYERLRDKHFDELADQITNSKADPIIRELALHSEATSMVGEAVAELRARIQSKKARSSELRVAVDGYAAIYDRTIGKGAGNNQRGGVTVNIGTFQPSASQAAAMTEAEEEIGLDITDVLNVKAINVESTPTDAEPEDATS